jgi:hypothetical protein
MLFISAISILGPSINDVTALGGSGYQGFRNNSTEVLVPKRVTMGEGVSEIIKDCMTAFMDDPLL